MPYTLEYKDRYRRTLETRIESDTSDSVVFASIPDNTPTRLITEWTGRQYTKLLSAVMVGSDLMFPDEADEIIWQLIKVVHQPINPEFEETGCTEYLPSASFIKFFPDNPYISGDTSSGWNKEAWYLWPQFDTIFPDWFDNWLNGAISSLTNYQATDVLFNLESIPINPIDAFLSGGGILPKIEIKFTGTGELNLTLLSFPLGGKAVIELDQEPNILDILTGGILDPAAFMVELNRDVVNFPPDEYPIIQIPINVETSGNHTLYICYIPTLDDSLIPVAFGGGFRSVEFCGFAEQGNMGIEQIVWDGCELKSITGGIETVIVTAEEIQACLDIPEGGGGGGGGGGVAAKVYEGRLGTNQTSTSTSFVDVSGISASHSFTKQNALIQIQAYGRNQTANAIAHFRAIVGGNAGDNAIEVEIGNNVDRTFIAQDVWSGISAGSHDIKLQFKVTTGTALVSLISSWVITILEFDDVSDLFVEDIRISGGELQKKIGGVWLDVSDSFEAIINNLQSQVSSALSQAAAANSLANTAYNLAQSATNVNNTQNTRLNALEAWKIDVDVELVQNALDHDVFDSRLDSLEASGGALPQVLDYSFLSGMDSWTVNFGCSWVSGQGFVSSSNEFGIDSNLPELDDRVLRIRIGFRMLTGGTSTYMKVKFSNDIGSTTSYVRVSSAGTLFTTWVKQGKSLETTGILGMIFELENSADRARIESIRILSQ